MRTGPRPALALAAMLVVFGGCSFKIAGMSRDQGRASMGCEDAQYKMRIASAESRRIVVHGCGEYEVYEGSCNGETNGCDSRGLSSGCDGSCRIRRTGHGELTEEGKVPAHVLKGETPDEDE